MPKNKLVKNIFFVLVGMLLLGGCQSPKKKYDATETALEWAKLTTYITQYTPSNSPTFASRAFAYISLTMYECVVHSDTSYNSMALKLNGLNQLPQPDNQIKYNWTAVLNAGQAKIIKLIYQQTSDENIIKIDSLKNVIHDQLVQDSTIEIIKKSESYGEQIAQSIFNWSKTDGGHRGYLKNFDKDFYREEFLGSWKPPLFAQSFSHKPLHPYWGQNRTFAKSNRAISIPEYLKFDTVPGSPYYEQFLAVYKKEKTLTQKEKEAAIWWGDDPDVSFTPPGHSYYLATVVLDKVRPDVVKTAQTLAQTALAVADAFIKCWEWKYHYFSERPNTYVPKYIDQEWESFWPDPPFPAFPSGHAIQAAAAATVLEANLGTVSFIDKAHEGRPKDEVRDTEFVSRRFDSFWDFALETADSRFYGGIHTPIDNTVGLENGKRIANNILDLNWKNE
ncbi:phosphoesterase [Croceivirga radicis]|uniref:Phosphoesterase n=1 Tax=Croceivirga radicis TaxID=1929488 RepID=A0A1V6LT38_9FLAO|nr:phosphoesterase [Croceivirga radicis]